MSRVELNKCKLPKIRDEFAHLRPRPCPPLGGAYGVVTGSPRLGTALGAVLAVDESVGAVVERLHALHHPGLVAKLPAGLTAGAPLLHHPPVITAGSLKSFP